MTVTLRPTYDLETHTWWVAKPYKGSAPTVRKLLAAVRSRHKGEKIVVADYFPLGSQMPIIKRALFDPDPKKRKVVLRECKKTGQPSKIDEKTTNLILDLWSLGKTSVEISVDVNLTAKRIRKVVSYHRDKYSDPRAVRRNTSRGTTVIIGPAKRAYEKPHITYSDAEASPDFIGPIKHPDDGGTKDFES
jgi:hypothetical protein